MSGDSEPPQRNPDDCAPLTISLPSAAMTLRFIHAGDVHLDSPLRGLRAYPEAPQDRLRAAPRRALRRLVDTAIETEVPLLLLAGDIFDGTWPDMGTGLFFNKEMARLKHAGIRVVAIRGNHDAESRVAQSLTPPDNVTILDSRAPQTLPLDDLGAAVHGQSFARPDVRDNLALGYPAPLPGRINLGLLHTALEGDAAHASYAPCRLIELTDKGYDYWALGHVHEGRVLADGTAPGGAVAYSGVLQGRHIREPGPKGAWLVEIAAPGAAPAMTPLILDSVRWHPAAVDLGGVTAWADLENALAATLQAARDAAPPDADGLTAVRLHLHGATALHGELSLYPEEARAAALNLAQQIAPDGLFIEKVVVATAPPSKGADAHQGETAALGAGALADLDAELARAPGDATFAKELLADLTRCLRSLDSETLKALNDEAPETVAAIEKGNAETLLAPARQDLMAYLQGREG